MLLIGSMALMEKTIPLGHLQMRPLQWYLKTCTCVTRSQGSSAVVDQCFKIKFTSSEGAQSPSVHERFSERLGCSLKASQNQWSVESGGIKASHKHSRAKSSVSSFKIIQKSASES